MFRTVPSLAIACTAAVSLAACNSSPNAPSSGGTGGVAVEAGPNGETLKVPAPMPLAPTNDVHAVDILGNHCGGVGIPTWSVITGVGGQPASWTSRGRW